MLCLLVGPSFGVLAHLLLFLDHNAADVVAILRLLGLWKVGEGLLLLTGKRGLFEISRPPVALRFADWLIVAATVLVLLLISSLALGLLLRVDFLNLLLHEGRLGISNVLISLLVLLVQLSRT